MKSTLDFYFLENKFFEKMFLKQLECMAGLPDFARNQKPPPVSIYFQNVAIFRSKELTRPNSMPTLTTTSHAPSQEQIAQVLNG